MFIIIFIAVVRRGDPIADEDFFGVWFGSSLVIWVMFELAHWGIVFTFDLL